MAYKILVLKGDGIGPEVVGEALQVLKIIARRSAVDMDFKEGLIGGHALDATGNPSEKRAGKDGREAVDTCFYSEAEIARVLRFGFELARERRQKLTSVDKANVLSSSRLWREIATELSAEFKDVAFENQLVDSMAMHLIRRPKDFDVVVTENMFGDILTDEASVLAGSMGLLPSASLGEELNSAGYRVGLYEPIHGSAPDIAGRDEANPLAAILSGAMLLDHSLGLKAEAELIVHAVEAVVREGYRTRDLGGGS